eukprot:4359442-Pyramimonas_sp.AAC.1
MNSPALFKSTPEGNKPTKHDRPTNPERNIEMQGMATLQRHLIGRRANAMLSVSILNLMYRAERCAVLRRAELR